MHYSFMDSLSWQSLLQPTETFSVFRTLPFPAGKIRLCCLLPSSSCQEENLDVLSALTLQLGPGDVLATAGRKRLPRITHLVLHLLSLLPFQAETHGRYLYKHSISALYQVHLHCTWRGAQKLLSKSGLLSIPRVDTGVWEGPGVPHADLEASVWLPQGWWIKTTIYLHLLWDAALKPGSTASKTRSLAAAIAPVPVAHF